MRTRENSVSVDRFWILAVVLSCTMAVQAATLTVDDDASCDPGPGDPTVSDPWEDGTAAHPFDAIQEGIDAAFDGDEVVVLPGSYSGAGNRDLDYSHSLPEGQTRAITVRSTDPNDPNVVGATTIDCDGTELEPHRGFHFHAGEDANSVLAGLTITHGYGPVESSAWGPVSQGGGIYVNGSSPLITRCRITNNAAARGGGVSSTRAYGLRLLRCTIAQNSANIGGGIHWHKGRLRVEDCTIRANAATAGGGAYTYESQMSFISGCDFIADTASRGGGLQIDYDSAVEVTDCQFLANKASQAGGGGLLGYSDTCIKNCLFVGNFAGGDSDEFQGGGALYSYWSDKLVVLNCTLVSNTARKGGAIAGKRASHIWVGNSILANNQAEEGSQISLIHHHDAPSDANCIASLFTGGEFAVSVEEETELIWGSANMNADPEFLENPWDGGDGWGDDPNTPAMDEGANDSVGNLRLSPSSPAIDAGNNDLFYFQGGQPGKYAIPPYDLDNRERIVNTIVDMGAYEFQGHSD